MSNWHASRVQGAIIRLHVVKFLLNHVDEWFDALQIAKAINFPEDEGYPSQERDYWWGPVSSCLTYLAGKGGNKNKQRGRSKFRPFVMTPIRGTYVLPAADYGRASKYLMELLIDIEQYATLAEMPIDSAHYWGVDLYLDLKQDAPNSKSPPVTPPEPKPLSRPTFPNMETTAHPYRPEVSAGDILEVVGFLSDRTPLARTDDGQLYRIVML